MLQPTAVFPNRNSIRHHGITLLIIKFCFSAEYYKGFPSLKVFVSFTGTNRLLEVEFFLGTSVKSCLLLSGLFCMFSLLLALLALECRQNYASSTALHSQVYLKLTEYV